jgi:hypothetical protein
MSSVSDNLSVAVVFIVVAIVLIVVAIFVLIIVAVVADLFHSDLLIFYVDVEDSYILVVLLYEVVIENVR